MRPPKRAAAVALGVAALLIACNPGKYDGYVYDSSVDPGVGGEDELVCNSSLSVSTQACADCLGSKCCDAFVACAEDPTCTSCGQEASPGAECAADEAFQAASACAANGCADVCP